MCPSSQSFSRSQRTPLGVATQMGIAATTRATAQPMSTSSSSARKHVVCVEAARPPLVAAIQMEIAATTRATAQPMRISSNSAGEHVVCAEVAPLLLLLAAAIRMAIVATTKATAPHMPTSGSSARGHVTLAVAVVAAAAVAAVVVVLARGSRSSHTTSSGGTRLRRTPARAMASLTTSRECRQTRSACKSATAQAQLHRGLATCIVPSRRSMITRG